MTQRITQAGRLVLLASLVLAGRAADARVSHAAPEVLAAAVPAMPHSVASAEQASPPAGQPAAEHVAPAAGQDAVAAPPAHAPAAAGEHGKEAEHANPLVGMLAKLLNFAILAGTLVYFLKSPFNQYLSDRKAQIRGDLLKASQMKESATAQLAAVDRKMAAFPIELDGLRVTGAAEVAAEEARIRELADKERARLLTQMSREIDRHGKAADRNLVRLAADRAVAAATRDIENTMTPADHSRLVERYVELVGK